MRRHYHIRRNGDAFTGRTVVVPWASRAQVSMRVLAGLGMVLLMLARTTVEGFSARASGIDKSKSTSKSKSRPKPAPHATSSTPSNGAATVKGLQKCYTAKDILEKVGSQLDHQNDPHGTMASLVLVRLAKVLVNAQNRGEDIRLDDKRQRQGLSQVVSTLVDADWNRSSDMVEVAVEGTKSLSLVVRMTGQGIHESNMVIQRWNEFAVAETERINESDGAIHDENPTVASVLQDHHLSGLVWSFGNFELVLDSTETVTSRTAPTTSKSLPSLSPLASRLQTPISTLPRSLPESIKDQYEEARIPFRIIPGAFSDLADLAIDSLMDQVEFQVDSIRTTSNQVVRERRQTAWQGDDNVNDFAYSGKSMPRRPWSPTVRCVRDQLYDMRGHFYDGCLLNLYPDGGSGMRYHIDPDQGVLWDFQTAVVSIGAARRFAFREIPPTLPLQRQQQHHQQPRQEAGRQFPEGGQAASRKPSITETQRKLRRGASRRKTDGKKRAGSGGERDDGRGVGTTNVPSIPNGDSNNDNNNNRNNNDRRQPHNFVVMHGDVCEMVEDCQMRFQHTVKTADDKNESAPRVSLVFKRTWQQASRTTSPDGIKDS